MYCSACGSELLERQKFCGQCGSLQHAMLSTEPNTDEETKTLKENNVIPPAKDGQSSKETPSGTRSNMKSTPSYDKWQELLDTRNKAADCISVFFHVVVSKDFNVNPGKDKVIVRAGNLRGIKDWKDTVCEMHFLEEIKDLGLLYRGKARIPAECLDGYIPYKYVMVSKKGNVEYEHIYNFDDPEKLINRCLHMPSRYVEGDWQQYDDVCFKEEQSGFLQQLADKFLRNKSEQISKAQKYARRVMLDGIFRLLGNFNDENVENFFKQLQQFCAMAEQHFLFVGDRKQRADYSRDVKEALAQILEVMCEQLLIEKPNRLIAGLTCLRVFHQNSIAITKEQRVTLCHALCLEKNPSNKMVTELEAAQHTFAAYDRMETALSEFCQGCIQDNADFWVWLLPVLHTFSVNQGRSENECENAWAGLECLKSSLPSKQDSSLLMKMKEKKYLLAANNMVPRSWLCLTPIGHMGTFLEEFPVKIVDALKACCYKFSGVSLQQKEKVKGILKKLQQMTELQSKSLDAKMFKEYSAVSISLHKSICQNPVFKKQPEIISLSAEIILNVIRAAELLSRDFVARLKPAVSDVESTLQTVKTLTLEWMGDIYEHSFNLSNKQGKPTFLDELQAWDLIIKIGEEWTQAWKDTFLQHLQGKIQREEPLRRISLYCEHYDFFNRIRPYIGKCFEACAFGAVPLVDKTQNDILALINKYNIEHFGRLVSHVIEHSWAKDRRGKHVTDRSDVLKLLLEWRGARHIFTIHESKSHIISEFTEDVKKLIALLVSVFLETPEHVIDGKVTFGDMERILQNKEQFLEICNLQTEKKGMSLMDLVLQWRKEEICTFRKERESVDSLLRLLHSLQQTLKVNISDLQKTHREELAPQSLTDIFTVRKSESDEGSFGSAMSYYKLEPSLMNMAEYLHMLRNSYFFITCWEDQAKAVQPIPEGEPSSGELDFSIKDIYDKVFTPSLERCKAIHTDLKSGEITFEVVDKLFNPFKGKYEEMNSELRLLCYLDHDSDHRWIAGRVKQVQQYHELHVAHRSAQLIFDLKTFLVLSGNFQSLETLLNFASEFGNHSQKTLSSISLELMETKKVLMEMDDSYVQCLQEVLRCKHFLVWVKETLEDINELKVFVDLASIYAGENDMDVDRVAFFHDAVLGFAPLLYDVRPDFGFDSLMTCLEKLWKALKSDPHLPKKLGDSARHLEWLKTVKESHGSVELSSLSLATAINERGIYVIRAPEDNKKITLDSVLQLSLEESEDYDAGKCLYTLEELKELLNKLMLLSWNEEERNVEVETFSEVISSVQRFAESFIDLYLAGNMLFRKWEARIYCSEKASVNIVMNFHVDHIDELEACGDLIELLPNICRTMENFLAQWLDFISTKRSKLYFLNFYRAEQIVYLCEQYQRSNISEEAFLLLSFIKPNCTKDDIIKSYLLSKSDLTSDSQLDMMEFALDLSVSDTVSEKLNLIWKLSMESISSLFPECVDIDILGKSLDILHNSNTKSVVRDLHPSFLSGRPNLFLCPLSEMFSCSMAIYMHSSDQPLPSYDEVLLCSSHTDFEEVALFLHRCLIPGYNGKKIYSLINADTLSYDVAYKSEQLFQKLQTQGIDSYNLIIICDSSQEHCYIPSAFSQFKVDIIPQKPTEEIQRYLCEHFRVAPELVSAASVFKNGVCAGIVSSQRAGTGKSLYVKRLYEKLSSTFPNEGQCLKIIRLTRPEVDENKILEALLPLLDEKTKSRPMIFHFDITTTVSSGISEFLFKLLVLRCLKDSKGRIWKCQPSHLYIIEILEHSSRPVHQTVIDFFPKISCCSPKEILERTTTPTDDKPGMDMEEFASECFQRSYQYLIRFQRGEQLDNFTYTGNVEGDPASCLKTLLNYCGISDPSWSELRNFTWFLNLQLKDCEASVFCSQGISDTMQGFKHFVVKFMILMAKDFATPSLHITDQNTEIPETGEEVKEQELVPFLIRKRWESEPHPYIFFNDDHQCMTFIGFNLQPNSAGGVDAINPRNKSIIEQNIMSMQLYYSLKLQRVPFNEDFDQLPREEKIHRLGMVLGIKNPVDPDNTYELTLDNTLKIMAIKMRFRCGIPVVVMGETGCGKTRLIKFLCQLCKGSNETENMRLVKVHGGTTAENIFHNISEAQKIAKKNLEHGFETVLFFDEANTTQSISSIKEALCDHTIEGVALDKESGLQIIAACNPYRKHTGDMIARLESAGLGYRVRADETKERLGSIPLRQLVYRVHALPPSMMSLVWDFGQLNSETEKKYIQQIVRHLTCETPFFDKDSLLTNVLSASQTYMREKRDECSFVSLRDVERCIEVFKWFYDHHESLLQHQKSMLKRDFSNFNENNKCAWCLLLAVGVCYHASLERKEFYREDICQFFPQPYNDPDVFLDEITHMQDLFLAGVKLRETIAKNLALKENLFMMAICIELKIPLFLVGKPGSSKSLAKTIVADAMQGPASHTDLYKDFKQIHLVSFQCSPHSTPEGIIGTFKQCARFQEGKNLNEYVSVVVLDEIGLAEDSPKMPLKTLHPLLEDGCLDDDKSPHKKVGFIGISNWALDPAKMNRGIFVSRGSPSRQQLIKSAEGICYCDDLTLRKVSQYFSNFAEAYLKVCETQNKKEKEFFGLRDFYCLIKMVFGFTKQSKDNLSSENIARAVLRNFSGKDEVDALTIFLGEEKANVSEIYTIDLVMENINNCSEDCRYLLLLTKNYAALQILQQVLLKENKQYEIIFGSSFSKDQEYNQICRNIHRVKICMETGQMVILLNLQNLYESLYDAFNQYYVYLAGQKYVDLGLGTHRVKCRVHPQFRLIVIEEKEVVYKEFPIPLINRLEKHYLDINTFLKTEYTDIVTDLKAWVNDFTTCKQTFKEKDQYHPPDVFIGYHSDTCASVVLQVTENKKQSHNNAVEVKDQAIRVLLNCATPDSVIRFGEKDLLSKYKKQNHGSLIDLLSSQVTSRSEPFTTFTEITTFSRLLTSADKHVIEEALEGDSASVAILSLQQFDTEFSFLNKIRSFLEGSSGILILIIQTEFEEGSHGPHLVASAKYSAVNEINKISLQEASLFVYFITKLPKMKGGTSYVGFRGGLWGSIHIDDLRQPHNMVADVTEFQGVPISHLFYTKTSKKSVKDEELEENSGIESEDGDEDMGIQEPKPRPENLLNPSSLIRSCIHNAIGLLIDEHNESRNTKRIDILIHLLSEEDALESAFFQVMKLRIFKMLKTVEELMISPQTWVVGVAEKQATLQEAGTFRQSVWTRIQAAVTPLLSQILSVIDCNANLDLLADDQQNDPTRGLWLYIFQNEDLLPISYKHSDKSETFPVKHYMNISIFKENHLPFSWRIKDYLEEIWTPAQNIENRSGPAMKFLDIFSKTPLGKYISSQEPKKRLNIFERYVKDFILLTMSLTSAKELQIMEFALNAVIEELIPKEKAKDPLQLPWVHIAYNQFQHRLQNLRRILAIVPSVSDSLIKLINEPKKQKREMVLDIRGAHASLKELKESVKRSDPQEWLQQVKDIQVPTEVMCSEEYLRGHSSFCKPLINQLRSIWNCVSSMALFMTHLLVEENRDLFGQIVAYTHHVGQILEKYHDMKSSASLMALMNIPRLCRSDIAKANLSESRQEDIRKQCNAFFIDIICLQCFKDNSPPNDDVIRDLLAFLFSSTESGASSQPSSPFRDAVDDTPVIRSVILKLLLKYSFGHMMKHVEENFNKMKTSSFVQQKDTSELYLMFINCLEDLLFEKKQKIQSKTEKEIYFQEEGLFLQKFFGNSKEQVHKEQSMTFLQDVARVRHALGTAAGMLAEKPRDTINEDLLKSVINLCSESGNDWYRIYLIRKLVHLDGLEIMKQHLQNPQSKWMFPWDTEASNMDHIDPFLVYGDRYKTLRDGVTESLIAGNKTFVERAIQSCGLQDEEMVVPLILGIFSEITFYYGNESALKRSSPEQSVKTYIKDVPILQEQLLNRYVDTLLNSEEPFLRFVPDTPSRATIIRLAAHLAAILLSGNSCLFTPLKNLAFSPAYMQHSYLPTMPEDMSFNVRAVLPVNEHWYACPNGHYYMVGDCGRPTVIRKCDSCNATIGGNNHIPSAGNVDASNHVDQTKTGHVLGAPEHQKGITTVDRDIAVPAFILLRMLTHLAMLLGSEQDAQGVMLIVNPGVNDIWLFLSHHIERDLEFLKGSLGKSADDTTNVMHLIFHQMYKLILSGQDKQNINAFWSTKDARNAWEKDFELMVIAPVLQNLNEHLNAVNNHISKDKKTLSNMVAMVVYSDPSELNFNFPQGSEVHCSKVWSCREQVSIEYLIHVVQQKNGQVDLPLLLKFLQRESELKLVKFLPGILKLQKELLKKFHSFKGVGPKTIREFLHSINPVSVQKMFKKQIEEFILIWNKLRHSLKTNPEIRLPEYTCDEILTLDSDMELLFPCLHGRGLAATALTSYLIALHNSFINALDSSPKHEHKYTVSSSEVMDLHVISYEMERDVLPIILLNCQYSLESGKETSPEFNLLEIQRQIQTHLFLGKPIITLKGLPTLALSQDRNYENLFQDVAKRIPQEPLAYAAIDDISLHLKDINDISDAFKTVDLSLVFLTTSGGDPEVSLAKYVENYLKMGEQSNKHVLEVLALYDLRHSVALWQFLATLKSWHFLHLKRDPFTGVNDEYKQTLDGYRKDSLVKFLERNGINLFLLELHEMIMLKLRVSQNSEMFKASWTLKEVMGPLLEDKGVSFHETLERSFPEEISLAHCVEAWKVAAIKKWDRAQG